MTALYQTKEQYRCTWLKIYHHNIDKGAFNNVEDAKYFTEEGRFSILGLINDNYKIDGKFEFMIEFPNLTNNEGMNRWAQTDNPLNIDEIADEYVPGFEPVTLSWPEATDIYNISQVFCGLAKSKGSAAVVDGTCSAGKWYYSIGVLEKYNDKYIPGYDIYNKETILWLRVEKKAKKCLMLLPKLISIFGFLSD